MTDRNSNSNSNSNSNDRHGRFDSNNDRSGGDRRRFNDRGYRMNRDRDRDRDRDRNQQRPPQRRDRNSNNDNYYGDPRRGGAAGKDYDSHYDRDDRFRRDGHRTDRYNEDRRRKRGDSFHREVDRDDGIDGRYHRNRNREPMSSGNHSDDYGDSRDRRNSFDSRDHRRRRSRDYTSDEDEYSDNDGYNSDRNDRKRDHQNRNKKQQVPKKQKEWPPSFQKDESAYTFDTRSAMFYEPLSDFFYDPKSKLYYGNKKCAYFRYDDNEDPPFVQVQKMTTEQIEEQQRGETAGISQENVHAVTLPAAAPTSTPKIAIKFKTKKVKSVRECDNPQQKHQTNTVSKAKQQQIANIGKWNEKQAELKDNNDATTSTATAQVETPPQLQKKVRTTVKGEPICMICKKKFPNLAKLRLHENGSELHKKNLKLLQEKRTAKRKLCQALGSNQPGYTDRAEKRRQLHGTDLRAPASQSMLPQASPSTASEPSTAEQSTPCVDLLDANNLGHKMLQKMGYKPESQQESGRPKTANEHLRKEWDRIEAMAQKSGPRNR